MKGNNKFDINKTEFLGSLKQKECYIIINVDEKNGKITLTVSDDLDIDKLPLLEEKIKSIVLGVFGKFYGNKCLIIIGSVIPHYLAEMLRMLCIDAKMNEEKLKQTLEHNQIVIIDGMRSWEEYLYLKAKLTKVKIFILCIWAEKQIRYQRSAKRKYRSQLFGEQRDINELIGTNMGPTIAFADFLIKNNFSVEDMTDKLEGIYREVYFSL